jgi:hypothetical protein
VGGTIDKGKFQVRRALKGMGKGISMQWNRKTAE